MRRLRNRADGRFFRGGEFPRLMAMILMLVVLVMMMQNARNPATWRYFAGEEDVESSLDEIIAQDNVTAAPPKTRAKQDAPRSQPAISKQESQQGNGEPSTQEDATVPAVAPPDASINGNGSDGSSVDDAEPKAEAYKLSDLDPDQREAAEEDFQVVTDKFPLEKQDMGAYWRLVMWSRGQSFKELEKRARRDVLFTHLAEQPEKYRGKILRLNLHVRRTLTYETEEVLPGVTRMYEAWGPTNESRPNWPYCVAFPEAPEGLPFGANVKQRAIFVGYFLKLISYDAVDGKKRWAPLLVGRMEYDKSATASQPANSSNDLWIWGAGGIIVCFFAVRMFLSMRGQQPVASRIRGVLTDRGGDGDGEPVDVETWLEEVQQQQVEPEPEINPHAKHEHNGNGSRFSDGLLDWPSEQER